MKFITYLGANELATSILDEQIEQLRFLLEGVDTLVTFKDIYCQNY